MLLFVLLSSSSIEFNRITIGSSAGICADLAWLCSLLKSDRFEKTSGRLFSSNEIIAGEKEEDEDNSDF